MSDLRTTITTAILTRLEAVTVANGYNNTQTFVGLGDYDSNDISDEVSPMLSLVPGRCTSEDAQGRQLEMWEFWIRGFKIISSQDVAVHAAQCNELRRDIRKTMYASQNLDTNGVIDCRLDWDESTIAHRQATDDHIVEILQHGIVRFEEEIDA